MLQKELAKTAAFRAAWENVSYITKKDGKPFVNMQKNIHGAKYTRCVYAMQDGENELTVYTSAPNCGYIHESINCYNLVKYLKNEKQIAKTENYMPKQTYLEQVYHYDLDDIKEAVAARVEYLKKYEQELKSMIENCEHIYYTIRDAYRDYMNTAQELNANYEHKTLYYAVLGTVGASYPYC